MSKHSIRLMIWFSPKLVPNFSRLEVNVEEYRIDILNTNVLEVQRRECFFKGSAASQFLGKTWRFFSICQGTNVFQVPRDKRHNCYKTTLAVMY